MRTLLSVFVVLLLAACTQQTSPYLNSDVFITGVTLIDVQSGQAKPQMSVVIRGGQIHAVIPADQLIQPADADQVISEGGFLIPGLWDMHVHALSDPDDAVTRALPLFVANGVTGVRDMGSLVPGIVEVRKRLAENPQLAAPELYVAGPLLDGVVLPWYGDLPMELTSREDVEEKLPDLVDAGMDFLKVYDQLSQPVYQAVIDFANRNNLPVAGHAPKAVSMAAAARAGQRTIEHLSIASLRDCVADPDSWFDKSINAKFGEGYTAYYNVTLDFAESINREDCLNAFSELAAHNTYFTPTLVMELNDSSRLDTETFPYHASGSIEWCETQLSGIEAVDTELRERAFSRYTDWFGLIQDAGTAVLAGSDTPNNCLVPGFSLHWELQRLVEAGMSTAAALRTATVNAAAAMDRSDRLGQVKPGFQADLVLLAENPLTDIANTQTIKGVMTSGRWFNEPQLLQLKADTQPAGSD